MGLCLWPRYLQEGELPKPGWRLGQRGRAQVCSASLAGIPL